MLLTDEFNSENNIYDIAKIEQDFNEIHKKLFVESAFSRVGDFLVLGAPGSGKSTLVNFLLGCEMVSTVNDLGDPCVITREEALTPLHSALDFNTLGYPKCILHAVENFSFVDCPAFDNSQQTQEVSFCVDFSIELAIKKTALIRGVILVIESESFSLERAAYLRRILTIFSTVIRSNSNIALSVLVVITKAQADQRKEIFVSKLVRMAGTMSQDFEGFVKTLSQNDHIRPINFLDPAARLATIELLRGFPSIAKSSFQFDLFYRKREALENSLSKIVLSRLSQPQLLETLMGKLLDIQGTLQFTLPRLVQWIQRFQEDPTHFSLVKNETSRQDKDFGSPHLESIAASPVASPHSHHSPNADATEQTPATVNVEFQAYVVEKLTQVEALLKVDVSQQTARNVVIESRVEALSADLQKNAVELQALQRCFVAFSEDPLQKFLRDNTLQLQQLVSKEEKGLLSEKERNYILADALLSDYFLSCHLKLRSVFYACLTIYSKMVANDGDSTLKSLARFGEWLEGVPIGGIVGKFIKKLSLFADGILQRRYVNAVARLLMCVPKPEEFLEILARQLTIAQQDSLRLLSPPKVGVLKQQIEKLQRKIKDLMADDIDSSLREKADEDCIKILNAVADGVVKTNEDAEVILVKLMQCILGEQYQHEIHFLGGYKSPMAPQAHSLPPTASNTEAPESHGASTTADVRLSHLSATLYASPHNKIRPTEKSVVKSEPITLQPENCCALL